MLMKPSLILLLSATFFNLPSLPAQKFNQDPVLRWMNQIAQQELQSRANVIAQIHTVAEAERRKQLDRERIIDSLGGLPEYSGPLNVRIAGNLQAGLYTIEKIIFERLLGLFVCSIPSRRDRSWRELDQPTFITAIRGKLTS